MRTTASRLGAGLVFGLGLITRAWAQVPPGTSFSYQGRLTEAGALASGPYDFQFVLYDAPAGGTQVGPTVALDDVAVAVGLFTVTLDFGNVFGSEKRFLELGVRPGPDTGPYTPILPRQEVTPGPSAIFSATAADAQGLGGVPASQFVQTDDPRMTDARVPLPGSSDYVQNGTVPQPGVGFNVAGTGAADILNAATQYNLGGARILSGPGTGNLFAGVNAGAATSTASHNAFFGSDAGAFDFSGSDNAFFGDSAGARNGSGQLNSFFGSSAGFNNGTGDGNSFFGYKAGLATNQGFNNAFFGAEAGASNTLGNSNTYIGRDAGRNSTGDFNVFVGRASGAGNTTGSNNTLIGANVSVPNLTFATAIGRGAVVGTSNTVVLGRSLDTVQVPGSQTVTGARTVGGNLGAGTVDSQTRYDIGGVRVLGIEGTFNLFAGSGAGTVNAGMFNSFVGANAGRSNTSGGANAFFGARAGEQNTTGNANAFFGLSAGRANDTGEQNAFFGSFAGNVNTSGGFNAFFGTGAGLSNTTGQSNAYFGSSAGHGNGSFNALFGSSSGGYATSGERNTFLGYAAGTNVTAGSDNTFVGSQSTLDVFDTGSSANTLLGSDTRVGANLANATALGARAQVSQSDSLVLGSISGLNGAGATARVGIGTATPSARLHVVDGADILLGSSPGCPTLAGLVFAGSISPNCQNYAIQGGDANTYINRPPGGSIFFREANVNQVVIRPGGILGVGALAAAGTTPLCRNANSDISTCSSSLRYKTDIAVFSGGLELVERLRPIRFTWKASGRPDIGLAAEEVAEVDPLLAFRNDQGEIEGVNYSQLTAVLVGALQQEEERLRRQGREIEALKALVCQATPTAVPCSR